MVDLYIETNSEKEGRICDGRIMRRVIFQENDDQNIALRRHMAYSEVVNRLVLPG